MRTPRGGPLPGRRVPARQWHTEAVTWGRRQVVEPRAQSSAFRFFVGSIACFSSKFLSLGNTAKMTLQAPAIIDVRTAEINPTRGLATWLRGIGVATAMA